MNTRTALSNAHHRAIVAHATTSAVSTAIVGDVHWTTPVIHSAMYKVQRTDAVACFVHIIYYNTLRYYVLEATI